MNPLYVVTLWQAFSRSWPCWIDMGCLLSNCISCIVGLQYENIVHVDIRCVDQTIIQRPCYYYYHLVTQSICCEITSFEDITAEQMPCFSWRYCVVTSKIAVLLCKAIFHLNSDFWGTYSAVVAISCHSNDNSMWILEVSMLLSYQMAEFTIIRLCCWHQISILISCIL